MLSVTGVLLDSELSLKQHVNRTASTCFYHLRRLRQLKRRVNVDVMKRLISAFVFSRLDYCNGILSGLSLATIAPLQRVQNAAAPLVLALSRSDHVRPALRELHWLPVVYRIKFKLALVMFTIHTHQCPDYLTDSVHPYSNNDPAALGDQHQLLCSTYQDEIWRQSFLCGRASRVEQFASGSSSRGQFTLLKAKLHFFRLYFND